MIDTKEYRTVERAAAWLDSKVGDTVFGYPWPTDWRDRVDLNTLCLQTGRTCVVGQPIGGKCAIAAPWFFEGSGGFPIGLRPAFVSTSSAHTDGVDYVPAWKAYITATRSGVDDIPQTVESPANPEMDETSDTPRNENTPSGTETLQICEGSIRRRVSVSGTGLGALTARERDKAVADDGIQKADEALA